MIVYKSVLENENSGGEDGSSIKDAYKNKVFGGTTGLIYGDFIPFNDRAVINEGRWIIDTTTTTVWFYVDFDIVNTMSGDWYAFVELENFDATKYLPQTQSTTRVSPVVTNDSSSTNPQNSFFVISSNRICIHKGDIATANDHYIVYGSWQY